MDKASDTYQYKYAKVTILGAGATHVICPSDGLVWGATGAFKLHKVSSVWFFDPLDKLESKYPGFIDDINKLNVPVICPFKYPQIPRSIEYPIEPIVKHFGMTYFTNTPCYMLAYALMMGVNEIQFAGIDQMGNEEMLLEKGGLEFWVGMAIGMGKKVHIPKESGLCKVIPDRIHKELELPVRQLYGYGVDNLKELEKYKTEMKEELCHI